MAETQAERLARLSERMATLQASDVEMAKALETLNKIVITGNGVPSLTEQVRGISKQITEFIMTQNLLTQKQIAEKEDDKKWWRRLILGASVTTIIATSIPLFINGYLLWMGK
jgi:hypothetical protein